MDYAGELFGWAGEGAPAIEAHDQYSGMRSVQNLEAVINEGLRAALPPYWRRSRMIRWMCC